MPSINFDADAPIGQCIVDATRLLERERVNDSRNSARYLAAAATGVSLAALIAGEDKKIGRPAAQRFADFIERRLQHEPVSRILGRRNFWKDEFVITPAVLDPRPDTETLIEAALSHLASRQEEPVRILDLGTGSGALLCALLQEFPQGSGLGIDISADACAVARENVKRLGLERRACILNLDWSECMPGESWDIVVSNPPYIASGLLDGLSADVRDWDPALALDGGTDGLSAYRALAPIFASLQAENGLGLLEIGFDQARSVPEIMSAAGLTIVEIIPDLGGNSRVAVVKKLTNPDCFCQSSPKFRRIAP